MQPKKEVNMSLYNVFVEGGVIMYPLLLCSIIVWAVAIEKIYFLKQIKTQLEVLFDRSEILLKEKKISEAKGLVHNIHPIIQGPYMSLFEESASKQTADERLSRRLSEGNQGLRRYLWLLGTIGSSAPFIGLFGTVVGIIKSFESISRAGKSGFATVAGDLSEALVATASGIVVAVMAVMFYNFFQSRLSSLNLFLKNRMEDLNDLMQTK